METNELFSTTEFIFSDELCKNEILFVTGEGKLHRISVWHGFSVWLQNRLLSAGLEPVPSLTEKSCLASYYEALESVRYDVIKIRLTPSLFLSHFSHPSFLDVFYDVTHESLKRFSYSIFYNFLFNPRKAVYNTMRYITIFVFSISILVYKSE